MNNKSEICERESVAKEPLQILLNEHDVARITGLSVANPVLLAVATRRRGRMVDSAITFTPTENLEQPTEASPLLGTTFVPGALPNGSPKPQLPAPGTGNGIAGPNT